MSGRTGFQKALLVITGGLGVLTLCVAVMALTALHRSQAARKFSATPVVVKYPAPALELTGLDQSQHSLAAYAGQVVLVNFWATWCQPCLTEMPALEEFYQRHREAGFVVIGINNGEALAETQSYMTDMGLSFPIWLDEKFTGQDAFAVSNLPSSFLIDRKGQVRLTWLGAIELSTLEDVIAPIIKE